MIAVYANTPVSNMAVSRHESDNDSAFRFPKIPILKAYAQIYKVPVRALYIELTSMEELQSLLDDING